MLPQSDVGSSGEELVHLGYVRALVVLSEFGPYVYQNRSLLIVHVLIPTFPNNAEQNLNHLEK